MNEITKTTELGEKITMETSTAVAISQTIPSISEFLGADDLAQFLADEAVEAMLQKAPEQVHQAVKDAGRIAASEGVRRPRGVMTLHEVLQELRAEMAGRLYYHVEDMLRR